MRKVVFGGGAIALALGLMLVRGRDVSSRSSDAPAAPTPLSVTKPSPSVAPRSTSAASPRIMEEVDVPVAADAKPFVPTVSYDRISFAGTSQPLRVVGLSDAEAAKQQRIMAEYSARTAASAEQNAEAAEARREISRKVQQLRDAGVRVSRRELVEQQKAERAARGLPPLAYP